MIAKYIVITVSLLLFAWVIIENAQQQFSLNLFGFTLVKLPTVILFIISMLLGMFITLLITLKQKFKFFKKDRARKKELNQQNKALEKQEQEIAQFKKTQATEDNLGKPDNE